MALHLNPYQHRDSFPSSLDSYTSYSSDSSAPRTPSPREDLPYQPAVFSPEQPEIMHPDYQSSWGNQDAFSFNSEHRDGYDKPQDPYLDHSGEPPYNGKGGPDSRSGEGRRDSGPGELRGPEMRGGGDPHRSDYPPNLRRATFPYVRQDRERGEELPPMGQYPSSYMPPPPPPVGHFMHGEPDYPPPPGSVGSPHPPYHDYEHQPGYYRPPHPSHYPPPPMSMSHPMHHGHPLSMTYISPHTGLPVQHTDDAASKETQYLRRRCFNCHTTEPPSWRRSTLNPGKIVCNKCGLYERTHLRPRPLRFDELRAGNKARKTGPGAKKKGAQPVAPPAAAGLPPPGAPEDMGAKEPRDYNLVRRSSVSSSGSSSNGHSDWDSPYSSANSSAPSSGPSTTFSSPASGHYPLPRTHSPNGEANIRLPNAPSLSDLTNPHHSSPLMTHQSPHMLSHPPPPPPGGSPQLLSHSLGNRSPPQPPRKSLTGPPYGSSLGNGPYREMNGSSHSLHSNGDSPAHVAGSPAGSN